ncbi:hypothetical protein QTP88_020829 [Uroleucon formosanum]
MINPNRVENIIDTPITSDSKLKKILICAIVLSLFGGPLEDICLPKLPVEEKSLGITRSQPSTNIATTDHRNASYNNNNNNFIKARDQNRWPPATLLKLGIHIFMETL